MGDGNGKAIVHTYGTLLRQVWWSDELSGCIVVRPAGEERDKVAYVVTQVEFAGPSRMVFDVKHRDKPHDPRDTCRPEQEERSPNNKQAEADDMEGYVGALNGFDNAILVYIEAEEADLRIQPKQGEPFIPFREFRRLVEERRLDVPVLNPMRESAC